MQENTEQMQQQPRNKLELILYRLEQIERQTKGLVSNEVYTLESAHRLQRLVNLETAFEKQRANARSLWVGLAMAVLVPVLTKLPIIIQALAGS